jgi:hypothetical protein
VELVCSVLEDPLYCEPSHEGKKADESARDATFDPLPRPVGQPANNPRALINLCDDSAMRDWSTEAGTDVSSRQSVAALLHLDTSV